MITKGRGVAIASCIAATGLVLAACSETTTNSVAPPTTAQANDPSSVSIPGFTLPQVLATAPDGSLLYVAQNDGKVVKVNTPKYSTAGSWSSGITVPLGIAVSPDGKTIYMSNRTAGTVAKFSADSGAAAGSWSTGSGTSPTGIGLSPDGATIYVPQNASAGTGANKLTVRNASSGSLQQTWTFANGSRPRAVVISPDSKLAYVSFEGANRISVLDTSNGKEVNSWPLDKTGYATPGYLSLSKLGDLLYIATASPSGVVVLNTKDGSASQTWSGIKSAFGIAAANCSQNVFVSNWLDAGDVIAFDQPNQCNRPPSAPQSVTATWSSKSKAITVAWKPPASSGSSPITTYTATAVDKDTKSKTTYTCSATAPATTCQMTQVRGGPKFAVTATATNSAGTGPPSAPPTEVNTG